MKKLVKWTIVTLGIAAVVRRLKRRRAEAEAEPASAPTFDDTDGDPADELRRKLAESRTDDAAEAAPEPASGSVEERRADVHAAGNEALDEMRSTHDT